MTAALKKAFKKASELPEVVQRQLAEQLVDDIEGELRWDETLAQSQPLLERLAKKALQERKTGKARPKGFDEL